MPGEPEPTMNPTRRTRPLNQGGPSDQASQRQDARDEGGLGSQQGRPQAQAERSDPAVGAAESPGRTPAEDSAHGMSETERKAGTPDARATTDWRHGEGEPAGATGHGAQDRASVSGGRSKA